MCFGSGSQAQLAASQAASEAQRQSFQEALAFQKDIFGQQRGDRAPFVSAGQSATTALMQLLGLTPTLSGIGRTGSGSSGIRSTSGGTGGRGIGGTGGTGIVASPGGVGGKGIMPPQPEAPSPPIPAGGNAGGEGGFIGGGPLSGSGETPTTPGGPVPSEGIMPLASTSAVRIQSPDGDTQWTTANLAPIWQSKGWTVVNG